MDGGAWWAAVQAVSKSWTGLSDFTFTFHFHALEKEMAPHSSVLAWRISGNLWWATVYGVTQSQSRLKWLQLSSISRSKELNDTYSSVNTAPKLPRGSYCVTKESGACCKLPEQVAELLKEFQDPPAGWGQNNTWLKITQNNSVNIKVILVNKMCKKITGKV